MWIYVKNAVTKRYRITMVTTSTYNSINRLFDYFVSLATQEFLLIMCSSEAVLLTEQNKQNFLRFFIKHFYLLSAYCIDFFVDVSFTVRRKTAYGNLVQYVYLNSIAQIIKQFIKAHITNFFINFAKIFSFQVQLTQKSVHNFLFDSL